MEQASIDPPDPEIENNQVAPNETVPELVVEPNDILIIPPDPD